MMKINNFLSKIIDRRSNNIYVTLFFLIFLIIGLSIVKDYGITTDEPFQRTIGYFWYIHIIELFSQNFELINDLKVKFDSMYWSDELSKGNFRQYTVFFDLFAVVIEQLLQIEEVSNAFLIKHYLTFIVFFISSIFFYKIIFQRNKNTFISLLITSLYITSPRIFGESFYNCKDIVFMSFCVFVIFFTLKNLKEFKTKNIILLALFTGVATDIRIMGILLSGLFFIFFILSSLEEENFLKKNYKHLILYFVIYFLTVYIFWPFLWSSPIDNFIISLKSFSNYGWGGSVLYLGNYVKASSLPWHYIPVWILVSMPIMIIIFFSLGLSSAIFLFFKKLTNLSEKTKLWSNTNEKRDFFMLFYFLIPLFTVIILDSTLYGGWRHLYFLYPCLIYFVIISYEKLKIHFKKIFLVLFVASLIINVFNLIKLHPYQSVYFNSLVEKKANNLFEIDYWGLGNVEAVKFILKNHKKDGKTKVRTASFTPLNYSKLFFKKGVTDNLVFTGTEELQQKYVFTNFIFEENPKFLDKYEVPSNYKKVFQLRRGNIVLNEVFLRD